MRLSLNLCIVLFILSLFLPLTYGISIGISPGRVEFDNVIKEGYAERTVTVSTSSEDVILGHFTVGGEISEWITFSPNTTNFNVSSENPFKLKIIVQPPNDVRTGNYTGNIEFITDTFGSIGGRAGGVIKTAVMLTLGTEVTGEETIKCRAGGFSINDVEIGFPLEFGAMVINDGNVRLKPTISLDIWDQLQEKIVLTRELLGDEVLPTTQRRTLRNIVNDLDVGQYWATIRAKECDAEGFLTFSVVEKGGIIDRGNLQDILHKPWVLVGETVEIIVKFANQGRRNVNAKFKGAIRVDNRIVEVIETEEVIIPKGETSDITIFFTPQDPGRYSLTGRVHYNKKLTFEKGSIINVQVPEEIDKEKVSLLPLIIYVVIIITIFFILRKIIKERKRKKFT